MVSLASGPQICPEGLVVADPVLPMSVHVSLVEPWVSSGLLQSQGTECSSVCMGSFEGSLWLWCCLPQPGALGP